MGDWNGLEKFGPACLRASTVGHWRWHFQLCNLRKLAFHCFQRSVSETCDCVRGWLKSKNRSKTFCQKRQPSLSRLSQWFSSPSSCSSFSRLHHPPVSMLRKLGTRPSLSTSRTQKPQKRCRNLEKPRHRPNLEKPQHRPNLEKPQHRRCPNLEKPRNLEKPQNRCPNLEKPQNRCPNLERNATNTQRLRSSARTEKR